MIRPALIAALFSAACSAQPTQSAAADWQPPQPPEASRPVPKDAPLDAKVRNVPATTGRANLEQTPAPFRTETIGRFEAPFAMAFLPDGALLVTEKAGTLKLRATDGDVVDVTGVPPIAGGGQGGLLDVAPAPDFARTRTIYLSFAEPGTQGSALALAQATLETGAAPSLRDLRVIWRAGSNGPGGQFGAAIAFSPDGQSLFLTSGERQRFTPAQDKAQLIGKILRMTLDGKPAPGNPWYARGGAQAFLWSLGHRNPYGLLFTPDGRLWEEEMGPRGGDELNLIEPGKNYGWPLVSNGDNYSGQPIPDHPSRPEFAAPKLWWNPSISPAGMMVYTGDLFPGWKGSLLIGAMAKRGLVRVALRGSEATPAGYWDVGGMAIRDLAQAPDGSVWLLRDGRDAPGGTLVRLTPR